MTGETGFLHLNQAGQWPKFTRVDVDIVEGELRLAPSAGGFVTRGVFLGGPFEVLDGPAPWFRLRVAAAPLPEGAHAQFYTFASDGLVAPFNPGTDNPFSNRGWRAGPRDAFDVLAPHPPRRRLWVGGILRSDGRTTPSLRQMRLHWRRDTYEQYLPPLYRNDDASRDFLERFLTPPQSALETLEDGVTDLPRLFDPAAAPAGEPPSWLAWLAGWLAFPLEETWSETQARRFLAEAFDFYQRRGTREGLRRAVRMYAGVEAHIEEPGALSVVWSLGETSMLAFTTVLASGPLQGAVLGTTAAVDRSHLVRGDDFGAALFEAVAHRFCVRVYCGELRRPGTLERVRAAIEREKPAHTTYELCVIEPQMRVGVQSRVGVDSIVGKGPAPAVIGRPLDTGVLAAQSEPCPKDI